MKSIKTLIPLVALAGLAGCAAPGVPDSFYMDDPLYVKTGYFVQTGTDTYKDPAIYTVREYGSYGPHVYGGFYRGSYHHIDE